MTLTVRLDNTLQAALERYCTATGATKSHVVQESLAVYLVARQQPAQAAAGQRGEAAVAVSANYRAFADAGLVGAVAFDGPSADKAAVRAQAAGRVAARRQGVGAS